MNQNNNQEYVGANNGSALPINPKTCLYSLHTRDTMFNFPSEFEYRKYVETVIKEFYNYDVTVYVTK